MAEAPLGELRVHVGARCHKRFYGAVAAGRRARGHERRRASAVPRVDVRAFEQNELEEVTAGNDDAGTHGVQHAFQARRRDVGGHVQRARVLEQQLQVARQRIAAQRIDDSALLLLPHYGVHFQQHGDD